MKSKISVILVSFLAICMHVMGQTQRMDGVELSCNVVRSGCDIAINLLARCILARILWRESLL